MKKTLLLTSMLLALTVSVALAGGVNFGWGPVCYTEGGISAITFACTTNSNNTQFGTGAGWPMTASFVLSTPIPDFVGIDMKIEGQSDATPDLPEWWKLGATGDCRTGKASFVADMSGVADVCVDWYGASALTVFGYTWDGNRTHIVASAGLDTPVLASAGVEYYAGKVTVNNSKTVGSPACAGCLIGFKWGLYEIVPAGISGQIEILREPIVGGNHCLDWNNPILPCAAPVPARNTTWGQVKSLYR